MAVGPHDDCPSRERLSALCDGETGSAASKSACASWHADEEARRDWHAWQLIGDVLRSDELASSADRDARFLAGVRARLAVEAVVVMAPAPLASLSPAAARRPSRWTVPAAMAAGFVLVVGTFAVVRPDLPSNAVAPTLARVDAGGGVSSAPSVVAVDLREPARTREAAAADQAVIRDARLERYLAAHKQFAGTTALGVPSAFLRSATVEQAPR